MRPEPGPLLQPPAVRLDRQQRWMVEGRLEPAVHGQPDGDVGQAEIGAGHEGSGLGQAAVQDFHEAGPGLQGCPDLKSVHMLG